MHAREDDGLGICFESWWSVVDVCGWPHTPEPTERTPDLPTLGLSVPPHDQRPLAPRRTRPQPTPPSLGRSNTLHGLRTPVIRQGRAGVACVGEGQEWGTCGDQRLLSAVDTRACSSDAQGASKANADTRQNRFACYGEEKNNFPDTTTKLGALSFWAILFFMYVSGSSIVFFNAKLSQSAIIFCANPLF